MIILESLSSAKRRQASIFAEVIGYGSTSDAFRVTDMHEEGRGAIDAVKAALVDADVSLYDINYINAHGSSTVANDFIETLVTKKVFGHQAKNIPISSSKGSLGHLTAAAGAAEFIICVLAIRDQVIPPTANFVKQDPKLDLDYVPNMSRVATLNMVVNQSFGFGGQNNVLVLKRYCEDT